MLPIQRRSSNCSISSRLTWAHRNRLVLLKKQTGRSFDDIYSDELRKRGLTETEIDRRLQMVARRAEKEAGRSRGLGAARPIAYLGSSMDHS